MFLFNGRAPMTNFPSNLRVLLAATALWLSLGLLGVYESGQLEYVDEDEAEQTLPKRFYFDYREEEDNVTNFEDDAGFDFASAKKILYFTSYYDMRDFEFGFGHAPFVRHGCPVSNCYATNNRSLLGSIGDFDAVLFHLIEMRKKKRWVVESLLMLLLFWNNLLFFSPPTLQFRRSQPEEEAKKPALRHVLDGSTH